VFSCEPSSTLIVKIVCHKHHIHKVTTSVCVLSCLTKFPSHFLDMVSAVDLFTVRSHVSFRWKYRPTVPSSLSLLNLYNTLVLIEFLNIEMMIFRDTVCKQHVYKNMAWWTGVSTLQKQKLLMCKISQQIE
jgi:hypothetical protein